MAWLLAAVRFVDASGMMVLFFFTLYCTRHLGLSTAVAGRALGAFGVGTLIGGYFGGVLADRLRPFFVQAAGLLLGAAALVTMPQAASPMSLAVLMFIYGVAASSLFPANGTALAASCPPESLARGFSLTRLAANLGVTFGPAIGGFLAAYNYHLLFYFDAATSFIAAIVLLANAHKVAPAHAVRPRAAPGFAVWRDWVFLAVLGLNVICMMGFNQIFALFGPYFRASYSLIESEIGLLFAVNTILIALTEMPLIHALRQTPLWKVTSCGALFIAAGFGMIPLGRGWLYAALTVAVWTVGEMLFIPSLSSLVSQRAPDGLQGRYQGLFSVSFGVAMTFGPVLGSSIYQSRGGVTLWSAVALCGLVASAGFLALRHRLGARADNGIAV